MVLFLFGAALPPPSASAEFAQQGPKLVGSDTKKPSEQGFSVAISADGNTAIVGGWRDNEFVGAAWVYARSGDVWTQQGGKLIGLGAGGGASQGSSVALSADGNTAIIGGYTDSDIRFVPGQGAIGGNLGAAWAFTRIGGVWAQQGPKLVGVGGATQFAYQGSSVALSADGNTAIIGGYGDKGISGTTAGAAWVFTRSNGGWTQQGGKLVGAGAAGNACQGQSVALSADGNTAIIGGWCDGGNVGAAWIFARKGGAWTQQGTKLVGVDVAGTAVQGYSVSLSGDGNTALVGGYNDNGAVGAAWVYTRSGDFWTQQGPKLVGTGAAGAAAQGLSVSLSADGDTAILGGVRDTQRTGAAWVFTRSGGIWTEHGPKLVGTGPAGAAGQGYSVSLSADGNTAIVGGPYDKPSFDQYGTPTGTGAAWVYARLATASPANYQGLWWAYPPGSESGWGINFAHQGDIIFATWFTYDASGKPAWFAVELHRTTDRVYSGSVITVAGVPYDAPVWDRSQVVETTIGTMTVTFSDTRHGSVAYTVNGISQTKAIAPQTFASPVPTCVWGSQTSLALATNYQDLWWASPAGSQSGWGVNLTHQGDIIFLTWFTYDAAGKPTWFIAVASKTGNGVYSGPISTVVGNPFNALPWDTSKQVETEVGSTTITFADGNHATFSYTINGATQLKQIERQVFVAPGTVCE